MTEQPLVTIIIPSYNSAATLRRAVDSALAQSYLNLEILLIDDASTDTTPQILESYRHHPSIRIIINPSNLGATGNFNKGLSAARGEYLAILGSDDAYLPSFVARNIGYLQEHPELDLVYMEIMIEDASSETLQPPLSFLENSYHCVRTEFPRILSFGCYICFGTMLIRRDIVARCGFFQEGLTAADLDMYLRFAKAGLRFGFLREPAMIFRVHPGQLSSPQSYIQTGKYAFEFNQLVREHLSTCNPELLRGWEERITRHVLGKQRLVLESGYSEIAELQRSVDETLLVLEQIKVANKQRSFTPHLSLLLLAQADDAASRRNRD